MIIKKILYSFVFVLLHVIVILFGGLFGVSPLAIDIMRIRFLNQVVVNKNHYHHTTTEEDVYPKTFDTCLTEHFPEKRV